jgi:hypothetical protein
MLNFVSKTGGRLDCYRLQGTSCRGTPDASYRLPDTSCQYRLPGYRLKGNTGQPVLAAALVKKYQLFALTIPLSAVLTYYLPLNTYNCFPHSAFCIQHSAVFTYHLQLLPLFIIFQAVFVIYNAHTPIFALPKKRRVRLRARTPPFHGGDTGSNPVRGTRKTNNKIPGSQSLGFLLQACLP